QDHPDPADSVRTNNNRETPMWIARCLAAVLALVAAAAPLSAQEYPAKPVRVIVPTAPGGMADILARLFAQKFGEKTQQPIIVENKTGAGGVIAADYVAKSPADGYPLYEIGRASCR